MHFGFALDLSGIDLSGIDLLDTRLGLFPVNILFVPITSSRHLQSMPQDVFKTSLRRLQRNNFSSSKTKNFVLQDVFKTSWKTKNCYVEDVLKTSSRYVLETSSRHLQDQQIFAGILLIYGSFFSNISSYLITEILMLECLYQDRKFWYRWYLE